MTNCVQVADMSMRSHISVQVIAGDVGAHPGLAGAFTDRELRRQAGYHVYRCRRGTDGRAQRSRPQIRYSIRPHQKRGATRKRIARNDLEGGRGTMEET